MVAAGYKDITCIDISNTVVQHQFEKAKEQKLLEHLGCKSRYCYSLTSLATMSPELRLTALLLQFNKWMCWHSRFQIFRLKLP